MSAALRISDLHTTFGSGDGAVRAVRGIDLEIAPGGTYVLLGESGSGKSVTARSILGLYGPAAKVTGSVCLGADELITMAPRQLRQVRGTRLGLVPQDPTGALDPLRGIGAQLGEVLAVHGLAPGRAQRRAAVLRLLASVGIADPARVAASRPHQLSGGMRQRAVIAIAIAGEPEVLIADEPTTALDVTVQAAVLGLIRDLQTRHGMALLMVTHDVGVAEELGGTVGVMYAGRLVETGPAREVLRDPRHPYTRGLLASLPVPGVARGELRVIPGRPPLTGESGTGCAFAPRCPLAVASCRHRPPPLVALGAGGRAAACPVLNDEPVAKELVS
ncbi:dipeptide ABC transporter (ATP-binding subunit) [Frankia sp. AiPs1]|uniref:ABC transporter ATP-binding protein n=1 Tax=Frankia sp. AiPa1 TaxID=573492 RepID=UPI00202AC583|nr:ABC transporter ATP-binding protein [Frankia sp. AiPa1]MCL9759217.1 ABC transporter ATP-binding protein [Frankia sp. AiPa1]